MLADIRVGTNSSFPAPETTFNDKIYFSASNDSFGVDLWVTDGTISGTKNFNSSIGKVAFNDGFITIGDRFYFSAENAASGTELWSTDGTEANTILALDINPGSESSNVSLLGAINENLLLVLADDGSGNGAELMKIEGSILAVENNIKKGVYLFPNPASSFINTEVGQLEIFNALGNVVLSEISEGKVDVSNLESGAYILVQNGKKMKLIVE